MKIKVYADGSANNKKRTAAWAFRIIIDEAVYLDRSGFLSSGTNNEAEICSVLEALKTLKNLDIIENKLFDLTIYSDSKLVLGYITGAYQCRAEHLSHLYSELVHLSSILNAKTEWVKGHSGDKNNEACDKIAKETRKTNERLIENE